MIHPMAGSFHDAYLRMAQKGKVPLAQAQAVMAFAKKHGASPAKLTKTLPMAGMAKPPRCISQFDDTEPSVAAIYAQNRYAL